MIFLVFLAISWRFPAQAVSLSLSLGLHTKLVSPKPKLRCRCQRWSRAENAAPKEVEIVCLLKGPLTPRSFAKLRETIPVGKVTDENKLHIVAILLCLGRNIGNMIFFWLSLKDAIIALMAL